MIIYKYGYFTDRQIEEYKKELHRSIHRLLVDKDPSVEKTSIRDNDYCFQKLLTELGGFNILLKYPKNLVGLMSKLQAAKKQASDENFDFKSYRSLLLDAHTEVEKIGGDRFDN